MAELDTSVSVRPLNKVKRAEQTNYKNLAAAIIASAVREYDVLFFKSEWCRELCDLAGINYEALLEKMEVK